MCHTEIDSPNRICCHIQYLLSVLKYNVRTTIKNISKCLLIVSKLLSVLVKRDLVTVSDVKNSISLYSQFTSFPLKFSAVVYVAGTYYIAYNKGLLLVTDVSTTCAEVIFRVKWNVLVSLWFHVSGPRNWLVSLALMLLAVETRVKSLTVIGQLLSVSICLLLVKSVQVLFEIKVCLFVLLTLWISHL